MIKIYFDNRQSIIDIDQEILNLLELVVEKSLEIEKYKGQYEVSISLVDNKEIKGLNQQYRGIDRETDVLSFPMGESFDLPIIPLGDIIISVEQAVKQAKEYNHSLNRELAYLTGHSMFHLIGYDHEDVDDKKLMRSREKELMRALGIFKCEKEEQDL